MSGKVCKLRFWQGVRVKLLFNFPGVYLWYHNWQLKELRREYCHKGIHKLRTASESIHTGVRWRHYRYLSCQFCRAKIFTSEEELQRYHRYHSNRKARLKNVFSELAKRPLEPESKHTSGSGRRDVEESFDQ